ncbi:MAG: thiamine phosphate synthase [Eubacteriales bacterium]|nr:thiamine phosphate synthase [Eubacteriales bacterium]
MIMCMYRICITNRGLAGIAGADNSSDNIAREKPGYGWAEYLKKIENALLRKPDALILREKDLQEADYEELAAKVINICNKYGVKCFLNNFVNVAVRLRADRIQVSVNSFLEMSEQDIQAFQEIFVSVHSAEEAVLAQKNGADGIIAGHIFSTDCKKGVPARGLEFLRSVCKAVTIPVYAIGGIHEENAFLCINSGAAGVCMMSEYMKKL